MKDGEGTQDRCPHGIVKKGLDYCFPCVLNGGWEFGKGPVGDRKYETLEKLASESSKWRGLAERMGEALRRVKEDIPSGYLNCGGDKCRQSNCRACFGDDAVEYETKYISDLLSEFERAKGE